MIGIGGVRGLRIALHSLLVAQLLLSTGCAATFPPSTEAILNNGDGYQLMLIHRDFAPDRRSAAPQFHGCFIDKTVAIADTSSRRKLAAVLQANLTDEGWISGCIFDPHYAVRITRGTQSLDMLICFHCGQCQVFVNGIEQDSCSVRADAKKYLAALAGERLDPWGE